MKIKRSLLVLLILVILGVAVTMLITGCEGKKTERVFVQGDFIVEFLFEYNGCRMYRFDDGHGYVYWSDCQGGTQSRRWQSNGKGGYYINDETITTVRDTLK